MQPQYLKMDTTSMAPYLPSHVILGTPWIQLGLVLQLLVWLQDTGVTLLQDAT